MKISSVIAPFVGAGMMALGIGGMYYTMTNPNVTIQEFAVSSVQLDNYCSGTVIDDPTGENKKTILTAKHCVKHLDEVIPIYVPEYFQDRVTERKKFDFTVVNISSESDLALLQLLDEGMSSEFTIPSMEVYGGFPQFGDRVFAIAFPQALSKTVTQGFLGYVEKQYAFADMSTSSEFRRSSTDVTGGSSGGTLVLADADKPYLIGVLTGGSLPFISYWTPVEEIREFLHSLKPKVEEVEGVKEVEVGT